MLHMQASSWSGGRCTRRGDRGARARSSPTATCSSARARPSRSACSSSPRPTTSRCSARFLVVSVCQPRQDAYTMHEAQAASSSMSKYVDHHSVMHEACSAVCGSIPSHHLLLGANFLACPRACSVALALNLPFSTLANTRIDSLGHALPGTWRTAGGATRTPTGRPRSRLRAPSSQARALLSIGFHAIGCHHCNLVAHEVPPADELPPGAPLQRRCRRRASRAPSHAVASAAWLCRTQC